MSKGAELSSSRWTFDLKAPASAPVVERSGAFAGDLADARLVARGLAARGGAGFCAALGAAGAVPVCAGDGPCPPGGRLEEWAFTSDAAEPAPTPLVSVTAARTSMR